MARTKRRMRDLDLPNPNAEQPPAKKSKQDSHPLVGIGKRFTRELDMVSSFVAILSTGTKDSENLTGMRKDEFDYYNALRLKLEEMCPDLETLYQGQLDINKAAILLNAGRTDAKGADQHTFKINAIAYIPSPPSHFPSGIQKNPNHNPISKDDRGRKDDYLGILIAPANLDMLTNADTRRDFKRGVLAASPKTLPLFAYEGFKYTPGNMWEGAFKSDPLLRGMTALFVGPSAALDEDLVRKGTKSGNAEIAGMTHTTAGALAYGMTHMRQALSSDRIFNMTPVGERERARASGRFDYDEFYQNILDLLTAEGMEAEVEDLLAWWDERLFPSPRRHVDDGEPDMLDQLRRERAALRAQQEQEQQWNAGVAVGGGQ